MKLRNTYRHFIALALVSVIALGACGIRGELKTPPPLWGDGADKPIDKPVKKLKSNT